MKKIMMIAAIGLSLFVGGCGNMDIMDWHWTFDRARIRVDGDKWEEVKIKSWKNPGCYEMFIIETDSKVYFTHAVNVILFKNK